MSDRPIKGNHSGKYNMNFIDPNNDIPAYYNDMDQLQQLIQQYFTTITYNEISLTQSIKNTKYNSNHEHYMSQCSICTINFQKGQIIKMLPCKHCFHTQCVIPWFQKSNKCPNCRFQLSS